MVESYLHRMAKELLYNQIKEKGRFEYKMYVEEFLPIGNHGLYMEFPSMDKDNGCGWYPDECGCKRIYDGTADELLNNIDILDGPDYGCVYKQSELEDILISIDNRGRTVEDKNGLKAGTDRYSLKSNPGYCKCGNCTHLNYNDTIIHDIASIHKGTVVFAIEIINKHKPKWAYMQDSLNYLVFLIKAEDILKRVDNTPVYITSLMGRRCWS